MTEKEWIDRYSDKAETFYIDPEYTKIFKEDKGFLYYKITEDNGERVLHFGHTCTNDMAWWDKRMTEFAKENDCARMKTITMRSPRAYIRMTGAHLVLKDSGFRPNGLFYWAMEREVR